MNHKKELIESLEYCIEQVKKMKAGYIPAVVIVQFHPKKNKFQEDIHYFKE